MRFVTSVAVLTLPAIAAASPSEDALQHCLSDARVPFSSPSSADFAQQIRSYNVRTQYKPAAVAIPSTTAHISSALRCASASNVTVQPKSGGHSYTGFSQGGANGAFMISLEKFQEVTLGPSGYPADIAKVGSAQRLGDMALALYDQGKAGLPHGTCPGVGMGGHATHGGYGYNGRAWGLTLDNIVAMDAVLPNGTALTITPKSNPDLWFALRGAADSFAIITNFYMKTYQVPSTMVYFNYTLGNVWNTKNITNLTNMFLHVQDFANNASVVDSRLSMSLYFNPQGWQTWGQFQGSLDEFNSKIAPELLRALPTPLNTTRALKEPIGPSYNIRDDFFAKSITVPRTGLLTAKTMNTFFTYILNNGINIPSDWTWYSWLDLYGGAGSVINSRPAKDSSADLGDTFWSFQNYGNALKDSKGNFPSIFPSGIKPFIQGLNDAIPNAQKETRFGGYQNYLDDSLTPAQAHEAYFADTYPRLADLKKAIDPGMVITNPLGVGRWTTLPMTHMRGDAVQSLCMWCGRT